MSNSNTTLEEGMQAPDFTLPGNHGPISLADYRGQSVLLYFYPKDDTPGCTKQACGFESELSVLNSLNTALIGVSKDTVQKHEKFAAKHGLSFPLASDAEDQVCEAYGVWVEKSMYGRTYMGIERTTFLINPDGRIDRIWRKVKVPGHVEAVKDALQSQIKAA